MIKIELFILGVVRFHTAKFLNGPKYKSRASKLFSHWSKFHRAGMTTNMINLEREANKLSLYLSLSHTRTHTHTHTHTSGWHDNSFEGLLLFFCSCRYIYHFEQESRIHRENIVKMNVLRRAIRRHYEMKRRTLILNGEDVHTHCFSHNLHNYQSYIVI